MAFTLDGIVIDRIQLAVAEDFAGNLLYTLTQLSDATIETNAESKDAVDKDGTLIKRFYNSKTATLSATNAMMDFNIIGQQAGGKGKEVASSNNKLVMPKISIISKGTKTVEIPGFKEGTVCVSALSNNGTMGKAYTLGSEASETEFKIETNTLTLPTDATADKFIVKYNRDVTNGVRVVNSADQFPKTIRLTLKALAVDPCTADTLRACYIIFDSFQVDPSVSIQLTTDATFDFSGEAQFSYCSADKSLFTICMADDEE